MRLKTGKYIYSHPPSSLVVKQSAELDMIQCAQIFKQKAVFFCLFFNKLGIASLNYKDHQLMLKDGKFCYAITAKQLHCVKCAFLAQHRLK